MSFVTPYLLELFLSNGLLAAQRRWRDTVSGNAAKPLTLFYQVGDPYSHLCARLLAQAPQSLRDITEIVLVPAPAADSYPEPEAQQAYALLDAQRLAPAFGLTFDCAGNAADAVHRQLAAVLGAAQGLDDFLQREAQLLPSMFAGADMPADYSALTDAELDKLLQQGAQRRETLGHYLSGMWHFRGEWFWALDRLPQLQARLQLAGLSEGALFPACNSQNVELPSQQETLQCFYSFRSPYSYLVVKDLQRLQRQGVALAIKPVLPMVMRGLPVPRSKRLYIVRDVKRLASERAIPFGRIADPLGPGVEYCLRSFSLCTDTEQQLRFLESTGRAAWAEGLDLADRKTFRRVAERASLDWAQVVEVIDDPSASAYAEHNRQQMQSLGLWGVPSFQVGDFACWGQDRLWMAERVLGLR